MRKRIFRIAILVMVTGVPAVLAAQTLSLRQAIRLAWANRANIQAGRLDSSIRTLQTQALRKKYWPQVSAEYMYQYNPVLQTSILPIGKFNPTYPPDALQAIQFGTRWSQSAGLTVNQPLLDATTRAQIEEARLQEQIAHADLEQSQYLLAYDVAKAYVNIALQAQRVRSAAADSLRTYQSMVYQKEKYEANRLLKSDFNKARINHNDAVYLYREAASILIENQIHLLFLIGSKELEKPDVQIDTAVLQTLIPKADGAGPGVDSVPELRHLLLQKQLPLLQMHSEKVRYHPGLSLKGFLGANQYTNQFNPFEANSWFGYSFVGLDLKWNLLFGEDRGRKLSQLKFQSEQFQMQWEDKLLQYQQDQATAWLQVQRLGDQIQTQASDLELSRETVEILQLRVSQGQETAYNLNVEEAQLLKLASEYQKNRADQASHWLDYLKASGGLSELWK